MPITPNFFPVPLIVVIQLGAPDGPPYARSRMQRHQAPEIVGRESDLFGT